MWNFIEVRLITRPQQADVNVNIYTNQCQTELHLKLQTSQMPLAPSFYSTKS